jgi:hypothetical protein
VSFVVKKQYYNLANKKIQVYEKNYQDIITCYHTCGIRTNHRLSV